MTPPPDPGSPPGAGPRPKQPSQPDALTELDRTLYGASKQARREDPRRKLSSPSMAAMTAPAPATGETAPTVPAPRLDVPTLRATPATAQEAVRIVEPPTSPPGGTLPPPSQDRVEGELAALRRENDRLRALQSLPPDRGAWAKLGYRIAAAATGVVVLALTALGARMADKVGKVEDKNANLTKAQKKSKELVGEREKLWNDWGDRLIEVLECRHRKQVELNQRQFPEVQRAEPGPWPVFKNACGELPERPRELPPPPADVTEPP